MRGISQQTNLTILTYNHFSHLLQIYPQVTVNEKVLIGATYSTNVTVNGGISLPIALAIAFGIMAFVIFILAAGFCFWKRRNPAYLQVVRMADGTGKIISLCFTVLLSLKGNFEIYERYCNIHIFVNCFHS